jgi:hypothetical protein
LLLPTVSEDLGTKALGTLHDMQGPLERVRLHFDRQWGVGWRMRLAVGLKLGGLVGRSGENSPARSMCA